MSNVDTVKSIYEAFGRGDVEAILATLDEQVTWDTQYAEPAAPWLEPRVGRASVAGFFAALAPMDISQFEPHTFLADGDRVLAVIAIEARTGGEKHTIPNEGHLWTFGPNGLVVDYQHLTDTATHARLAAEA
jgi:ketosteroid isomerase-like protein